MLIKINSENIKKLKNGGKRAVGSVLCGALMFTLLTGCNKTRIDTKYGFDKALILGDDTSIIMDVKDWLDYEGEQLQLITDDNMAILTSSFDTNAFYGQSDKYGINEVATSVITEDGEVHDFSKADGKPSLYNKSFFDTTWAYNKAVIFNGNSSLVLSIGKWKDYEGEQLQVITKDGLVLNLSSYNSKLIYDEHSEMKAEDFAKAYVGEDGMVTDLASDESKVFNYDLFDTKYGFNKAIVMKDNAVVILPVDRWCDYEGEQIQIKITNGPTILTSAYDTILVNDITSETKAIDVAHSLSAGKVYDLTSGYTYNQQIYFNGTIMDMNFSYENGIISANGGASTVAIDKWNDYEGEQLQIKLPSGDVILASSMLLDLVNGGSTEMNASSLAMMFGEGTKVLDLSNASGNQSMFNQYIIDAEVKFNYALKIVDGNVTIIPLKSWQDFYNTNGKRGLNKDPFPKNYQTDISKIVSTWLEEDDEEKEEKASPNCEQIQLVLPDESAIVTTSYDTVLVKNVSDILSIAELFRGENGVITDLTPYVGEPNPSGWNLAVFDTRYVFTHAIMQQDSTVQVFPIKGWLDFVEGEQLQLNLSDNSGFLTSFVNTTLVSAKTEGLEETLAMAFNGTFTEGKKLVKIYE